MKLNYLFYLFLLVTCMSSCSQQGFLDETETTDLDESTVFADSTYTTAFLSDIYNQVGFSSNPGRFSLGFTNHGGLQTSTDEAEPRITSDITTDIQFITGTINPVIVTDDAWRICYSNIRKVNQLLIHLPDTPLTNGRKQRYEGEARFLRAWYYAILLKHYGGVPLVGDAVFTADDEIPMTRDSYADCVDYIIAECNAAAQLLPTEPGGRDFGRAGAGACMALKSRVLLFAASALYNGNDYAEPYSTLLGYPDYDLNRWKDAMDAAQAVIGLGNYSLYVDNDEEVGRGFYRIWVANDFINDGAYSGHIFVQKADFGTPGRAGLFNPPSRGGGGGGYPYQELIDAFPMSNGKAIDEPDSGYDPQDPYANRDSRLYNSIVFDQVPLQNGFDPEVPVDIYLGNYDGVLAGQDAVHSGTPTGYYIRKMMHRVAAANYFVATDQSRPLIRYAEILLNFAEAKNEFEGPTTEVYAAVEAIRQRAGLSPYELPGGLDKDQMREVIRNERRIELAFEGFRFWDVRRWEIAEETESRTMTGMEVIRDGSSVEYNRFDVRKHVFRPAAYFWPLPYDETAKSADLIQNPLYD
ncbi:MAG: RagB/SusD family nutrient uptake outer membrane protein [Cytophagaceae bacterium]|nr:RagB/SusD family nutrient uptake outer membrane protein [Cytophagaceae bacterium]